MKTVLLPLFLLSLVFFACFSKTSDSEKFLTNTVDTAFFRAKQQSILMARELLDQPNRLPQSLNENGDLVTSNADWWTSGFFPGVLWVLYENTQDSLLKKYAENYTRRLEKDNYGIWDHDIGFMIFNSYGNAYRITHDEYYKRIIESATDALASRFDSTVGCILSWDKASWNEQWEFPVIIDNMMNLEILMWSGREFAKTHFSYLAETHSTTTLKNHYRDDFSSFHVVSYDTISGLPELKHTAQGYNHESAWARGQAWGLYGFTMMYRESGNEIYLRHAERIADFLIQHPNLPEDKIPYWDFNAPNIPYALRDASAGAIMCSALLELSTLTEKAKSASYYNVASKQLLTLCSDEYLAKVGENGFFILQHGVGHMPNNSEIDVPLSYADYYFVEALMRYKGISRQ